MFITDQQIQALQKLTETAHIDQIWIKNAISKLDAWPNSRLYQSVVQHLDLKITPESPLFSRFALPATSSELCGDLSLAKVIGGSKVRFSYSTDKLPMHICASGISGSRKSTFAVQLEEGIRAGIRGLRIVDPKADDCVRLARKHDDIFLLQWGDLRFNPFSAAPIDHKSSGIKPLSALWHYASTFGREPKAC